MDKLERLYALHGLLDGRRGALPLAGIVERLECSPATAKRAIREMRTLLDAPLVYDASLGGYRYAPEDGGRRFELPGLWFRADELAALVTLRQVLGRLEPGLLNEVLAPLARRLEEILALRGVRPEAAAGRSRRVSVEKSSAEGQELSHRGANVRIGDLRVRGGREGIGSNDRQRTGVVKRVYRGV
ncbi:MAG: hypothetical protein HY608_05930 [Planctomycetes bacterium]|nr:hypothetical protein [Planctomycetota bacterium]